jgi:DNA-binding PadR family transcriptional regulator
MAMRGGPPLVGEVEQLVLIALVRLGDGAYAVPIRALVEKETGIALSRGAVYITLDRLEAKGYVASWFTEPMAVRGGKARRVFRLTREGLAAARASKTAVDRLAAGTSLSRPLPTRGKS